MRSTKKNGRIKSVLGILNFFSTNFQNLAFSFKGIAQKVLHTKSNTVHCLYGIIRELVPKVDNRRIPLA